MLGFTYLLLLSAVVHSTGLLFTAIHGISSSALLVLASISPSKELEQSLPYAREVAHLVGCQYGDTECLRSVDVSAILSAQGDVKWIPLPVSTEDDLPWQPTVDYVNVLGQPYDLISHGVFVNATYVFVMMTSLTAIVLPWVLY